MFKFIGNIMLCCILVFGFQSCGEQYQDVLKSTDNDYKLERAMFYYEEQDFYKALPIFQELMNLERGTEKAEKIYYHYAQCHYRMNEVMLAAYHFKNFAITYPNSQYTEESQYLFANCYYRISPVSSLEQTNTIKAIEAFQLFVTLYPNSDKIKECNDKIDELRLILQEKDFETAKLYLKLEYYEAAKLSFESLIKDYPDFKQKEEAAYLAMKAYYKYAYNSVQEKQKERFTFVIPMYNKFLGKYPESKFLPEVKSIFENTNKQLDKLNS
jgi:outer membrane protein assembly factor BamD